MFDQMKKTVPLTAPQAAPIEPIEKQLSVDVYQTSDTLMIRTPIAGAKLSDIAITITNDVITIRGKREHEDAIDKHNYMAQECYWGPFSRSIILPNNLKTDEINAHFKHGVLKIEIPKTEKAKTKVIDIASSQSKPSENKKI